MSNQEILEKAIKKAIKNGWMRSNDHKTHKNYVIRVEAHCDTCWPDEETIEGIQHWFSTHDLMFDHGFAKALWGEGKYTERRNGHHIIRTEITKSWKRHLMAMVISEDPIKYLGEHLDG